MASSERRIVDSFWDLRDDAYDNPGRWQGVTAERLFQQLAEYVEQAEENSGPLDWRSVAQEMIAWRAREG